MLAMAIGATTCIYVTYRLMKPEIELRRRRQAESYANFLYETEQKHEQSSVNYNNNTN